MNHVKGYDKLTKNQQELLIRVHKAHLSAMGSEMRKKHTSEHITKVEWNKHDKVLNVFYDNNEWYQYYDRGWS